uniref:Uncharacterized protein n=1 Tax=Glossina brevipalpis TaxID=37001 RepID=A0A1A9X2F7_9MUSC
MDPNTRLTESQNIRRRINLKQELYCEKILIVRNIGSLEEKGGFLRRTDEAEMRASSQANKQADQASKQAGRQAGRLRSKKKAAFVFIIIKLFATLMSITQQTVASLLSIKATATTITTQHACYLCGICLNWDKLRDSEIIVKRSINTNLMTCRISLESRINAV